MAFVCALIAFALVRSCKLARPSKHRFTIACCAIAGTVCGLGLPPSFDPARSVVMTHAPVRSSATPLFAALEQLDERPQSLLGRRITVSGSWHPPEPGAVAAVSQRVMACCAADAVDVGFDVVPARAVGFAAGESVSVSGIVRASLRDGETRYALTDADVRFSARSISARSSDAK
jgi:uncharacterized membrane protein YcgQ (UPF0703/DUF1980 family)